MSSSWVLGTTTRPCTTSSITVSPSRGALSRRTGLDAGRGLLGIAVAPGALDRLRPARRPLLLLRQLALRLDGLMHGLQLGRRQIAAVGVPCRQQLLGHLAMALGAGELVERLAVPLQAQPLEGVDQGIGGGLRGALAVGVLDAQQELAAGVARIEPVEQRRARPADVEVARGRGSKAGDDGVGHVGGFRCIQGAGLEPNARRRQASAGACRRRM